MRGNGRAFQTANDLATQLLLNHLFIRVIRVIRGLIFFWREGVNDFLKARIAAERVPPGSQF